MTYGEACSIVAKKYGLGQHLVTGHRDKYWSEAAELYASECVTSQNATIEELTDKNKILRRQWEVDQLDMMELTKERDKLKEENDILTGKYKGASDLNAELQAEIQTLKEERDRFAVGFAKFCQVDPRGRTFKGLLEEFKNISKKE